MPTALLLEDDAPVRSAIRAMLAHSGWAVLEAESAPEAIARSQEFHEPIKLLIADVALKEGSATHVAKRLLKDRSEMACLFVSGYPLRELYRRGLLTRQLFNTRRIQFLAKPFSMKTFLEILQSMTEQADTA